MHHASWNVRIEPAPYERPSLMEPSSTANTATTIVSTSYNIAKREKGMILARTYLVDYSKPNRHTL